MIFVWYHPARAEPKWEVASLPKCPEGDWVLAETHDWVVNIHCQEITENGQDHAHFGAVHGVASAPKGEFRLEGWVRRNTVVVDMPTPRGPMSGKIDVTATGPGQSITNLGRRCMVVTLRDPDLQVDGQGVYVMIRDDAKLFTSTPAARKACG